MESKRRASTPVAARNAGEAHGKPQVGVVQSLPLRQRDTAEYLSEMILELRNLARAHQLYTVMVPLEYAYYEAFGVANKVEIPQSEVERIKELSRASQELEQLPPAS